MAKDTGSTSLGEALITQDLGRRGLLFERLGQRTGVLLQESAGRLLPFQARCQARLLIAGLCACALRGLADTRSFGSRALAALGFLRRSIGFSLPPIDDRSAKGEAKGLSIGSTMMSECERLRCKLAERDVQRLTKGRSGSWDERWTGSASWT
jgi:hypothetical protein